MSVLASQPQSSAAVRHPAHIMSCGVLLGAPHPIQWSAQEWLGRVGRHLEPDRRGVRGDELQAGHQRGHWQRQQRGQAQCAQLALQQPRDGVKPAQKIGFRFLNPKP